MAINLTSWHCHGLRVHIDDLKSHWLQETYLAPGVDIKITNYNIIRKGNIHSSHATGGVALMFLQSFPCKPVPLNTTIQAVAIQIHVSILLTICTIYLPPNQTICQSELDNLLGQLPAPFILVGDMNGHSCLWESSDTNSRGLQIEKLIFDHNFCILNDNSKTYFHSINRTFHTIDLAICSPSILTRWDFTVDENLYNSDHFPIILKHFDISVQIPRRPEHFIFDKANWQLFTLYSELNPDMVQIDDIDSATEAVTKHILEAAERSIPKTSGKFPKQWRPWWDEKYAEACKKLNKAWNYFRRYPTTNYYVAFKEAKAVARRIKRQNKRNTFQNYVSSIHNNTKSKVMWEKVRKLLVTWRKAVVIPIPKPGKDPQIPATYRPIALTSCLCKLMERMVNALLVHVLEENGFLSNFQSGFRYGRGTIDNVVMGSPSLGGYGCPNPEVPRVLYSLPVYPPLCLLLFAAFFHPSTASAGALHEKLLPLCLLLASHGQPKPPRVGRAWRPFGRVVHCWSPVYQFGWYPNRLVSLLGIKRKGHSLGLGAKGGQRSWR
ncbi:hypothetical protein AVEN_156302-1 [Araneus ventricosus]|uniref:Endonuclease/exonuclease/phosphatase domain-containing protein n=1 Tax=Araneus ventricosus TaxID=182803 RepID=A0A4Y2L553_ARAVE|nr:hypothetical protein AVEN_156302-1 [Araneus ventricosus]